MWALTSDGLTPRFAIAPTQTKKRSPEGLRETKRRSQTLQKLAFNSLPASDDAQNGLKTLQNGLKTLIDVLPNHKGAKAKN